MVNVHSISMHYSNTSIKFELFCRLVKREEWCRLGSRSLKLKPLLIGMHLLSLRQVQVVPHRLQEQPSILLAGMQLQRLNLVQQAEEGQINRDSSLYHLRRICCYWPFIFLMVLVSASCNRSLKYLCQHLLLWT